MVDNENSTVNKNIFVRINPEDYTLILIILAVLITILTLI